MVHRKKIILFMMMFVIVAVIPIVSAAYSLEQDIDFKFATTDTDCNLTVVYPNTTILINDLTMNTNGDYANYTLSSSSLVGGEYEYYSDCGNTGTFQVNNNGIEPTTPRAILNASMLFLLVALFIFTVWLMLRMENYKRDVEGEILGINKLKYIKFPLFTIAYGILMSIFFIASNIGYGYLGDELFADLFFTLFNIMMRLYIVIILVVIAWFFFQIVQDKKMKAMIERGVDFEGAGSQSVI